MDSRLGEEVARTANPADPYAAFVWKTVADPFAGRITLFRILSGTLKSDSSVHNLTRDTSERLGHLTVMQGKTSTTVAELHAGDIGAVAKLKDTLTNDTLSERGGLSVRRSPSRSRSLSYAIEPKTRGDEDKISTAMHRLEEEDPTIRYARDPQTKELLLSGQGQLHIEVTVAKLKRRFGVEVKLKPPRIPYRETIRCRSRCTAATRSRPAVTGSSATAGSAWSRCRAAATSSSPTTSSAARFRASYIPAVEKGIQESRLRGYPRRIPGGRLQGHRLRRLVPRRGQQRAVVQDGRRAGVQGRDEPGASRRSSSR